MRMVVVQTEGAPSYMKYVDIFAKYAGHDELPNNAELSSMRLVKFSHWP
jgi:hypothetical protein